MPIVYCQQWNEWLDKPIRALSEAEARARHERGELYTAAFVPDGGTSAIGAIEVRLEVGFARVYQFDAYGRVQYVRTFDQRGDRMFLETAAEYTYPADSTERLTMNQASVVTGRTYEEDGTGRKSVHHLGSDNSEGWDLTLKPGESMAGRWVPVPDFGDYDALGSAGMAQRSS